MHNKRPWLALSNLAPLPAVTAGFALFVFGLVVPAAQAAGFAESSAAAVLGQPLDFTVALRTEPGEAIGPECVAAEVTAGDRRLSSDQVRSAIQVTGIDSARVRVVSTVSMDEPVVTIQVSVGCRSRISRRFVVFADPPIAAMSAPVVSALALAPSSSSPPAAPPTSSVPSTPGAGEAAAAPTAAPAPAPRAAAPRSARPARAAAASPAPRPRREAREAAVARTPGVARVAAEAKAATPTAPRLQLDLSEPPRSTEALAIERAIEAVAQAASATRAAASAASAAQDRIAALERTVEQLRGESNRSRDLTVQMREQFAQAQTASRWLYPLLAAVLLLGAAAAWLAFQLSQVRREKQSTWHAPAAPGPLTAPGTEPAPSKQATSPIPFVTSEIAMPPLAASAARARPAAAPAWPPPAPRDPDLPSEPFQRSGFVANDGDGDGDTLPPDLVPLSLAERTLSLPPHARHVDNHEGAARDVSIEELLDLEQQAEFFVVLGQDEAAVDLLVEHLRSTGGGSPLPYLKLLEIYHRRGDKDAYERTRTRFNHRFNAYAPEWETGLLYGRSLEDYTGIVPRLQQVWPRPLDAMAELEALLFRKSRGDMFDLPAYREVLFLYSLARDLFDREAADTGSIDLLLPLPDGGEFSATTSHPYFGLERDSVFDRHAADDRPTAPVDLDLTTSDRQASIFDPTDDLTRPRR